jgi:hypothetical protein
MNKKTDIDLKQRSKENRKKRLRKVKKLPIKLSKT